jgi:electron transfer flavoprotein beta subunit
MSELRISVCIKSVPDPRCPVKERLDPATGLVTRGADAQGIPRVISPMDRLALDAALHVRGERPSRVTVLTMDSPAATEVLRQALALGADRAILLSDGALAGADTLATARTLAAAVGRLDGSDLLLCGAWSYHGNTGQVGPQLAALLGMAHISFATELTFLGARDLRVRREWAGRYAVVRASLPLLVTVSRPLAAPRQVSLMGIVQARTKTVEKWGLAELGLRPDQVGLAGSPSRVAGVAELSSNRRGEILGGAASEAAAILARRLREIGVMPIAEPVAAGAA